MTLERIPCPPNPRPERIPLDKPTEHNSGNDSTNWGRDGNLEVGTNDRGNDQGRPRRCTPRSLQNERRA